MAWKLLRIVPVVLADTVPNVLTGHPDSPIISCFCPGARNERESVRVPLVPCCTDISMLHNNLNIRYNVWFLRKQTTHFISTCLEKRNSRICRPVS